MAEANLPIPLVPEHIDLGPLPWMRLNVRKVLDSDFYASATGDVFKAAFTLWCKAWHQVPAASLPDNDVTLALWTGTGSGWKRMREQVLHNFIRCSDGRLYHPVIAEQAIAAHAEMLKAAEKREAEKKRKEDWRAKQRAEENLDKTGSLRVPRRTETGLSHVTETLKGSDKADLSHGTKSSCPASVPPLKGEGRDGTGEVPPKSPVEPAGHSSAAPTMPVPQPGPAPVIGKHAASVNAVFEHWRQVLGHHGAKLGDASSKRYRCIADRLKDGYTVEQLKAAIEGCRNSKWHMGANDRDTVYDSIELICRDAKHVDEFMRIPTPGGVGGNLGAAGQQTANAAQAWLHQHSDAEGGEREFG